MIDLKAKNALIIGAKRIGQIVGKTMAREGINLAISYRTSKKSAERLKNEAEKLLVKSILIKGDITNEKDVKNMIDQTVKGLGSLDFVVDLASNFQRTPLDTLNEKAWQAAQVDAKGSYLLSVHASRQMQKNQGKTRGHIILFSDWAAVSQKPYLNYLPYLTSKAAIDYMTRAFAKELAPHGILVNAIAPGPTMRPPFLDEKYWQREVLDKNPLKRQSSAEEIAEMIVTLFKSETITGETIRIDSGSHLGT
ncbi:SDR family oxidoreductase [Candidatus Curtissbacteria bacterium]|nr:SDR family oxidoreductase [Candidatus Curtissbacteria bacterium]